MLWLHVTFEARQGPKSRMCGGPGGGMVAGWGEIRRGAALQGGEVQGRMRRSGVVRGVTGRRVRV